MHVPKSSLSVTSLMKNSKTKTTTPTQECPSNKKRDGLAGEDKIGVHRIQMDTNMAQHGKDLLNTMEWSQNEKLTLEQLAASREVKTPEGRQCLLPRATHSTCLYQTPVDPYRISSRACIIGTPAMPGPLL